MANRGRPVFHRAHYNILAKQFREQLKPLFTDRFDPDLISQRGAIVDLAFSLARRLEQDNPLFDPVAFLNACSPDPDMYSLSELWEDKANDPS